MRIEETRRFPVPRKQVYDYLIDPGTWPLWLAGLIEVLDVEHAKWDEPGDRVQFVYRLLGRRVEGETLLQEIRPAQYARTHVQAPAVGTVTQEWFYSDAAEDSMTLRVVYETDEPTSFFGKAIDRTVVPRALERDLTGTMANLEGIFAVGPPD